MKKKSLIKDLLIEVIAYGRRYDDDSCQEKCSELSIGQDIEEPKQKNNWNPVQEKNERMSEIPEKDVPVIYSYGKRQRQRT